MIKKEKDDDGGLLSRRGFLKISGLAGGGALIGPMGSEVPGAFAGEVFPSRKLTWVVGQAAGGGTDLMVRGIAPYFQKYLKKISSDPDKVGLVVKNLAGGAGMRTMNEVRHAKADGYTIACDGEMLHTNTILGTLGFDMFDMTYVSRIAAAAKVLVTYERSSLNNWDDLVKLSKKNPVKLGITGFGASNHVAAVLFIDTTRLAAKPVIFDGSAGLSAALIRGDVAVGMQSEDSVKNLVDANELRPLLTFSQKTKYPQVQNVKDVGFPELNDVASSQRYVVGPPGMPPPIKKRLVDSLKAAVADKDFLTWNEKAGMSIDPVFGSDLEKLVKHIHKFYLSKEKILKEYLAEKAA
jgi:tripartite-type tricarboxylate transporter receptor subunit TctC